MSRLHTGIRAGLDFLAASVLFGLACGLTLARLRGTEGLQGLAPELAGPALLFGGGVILSFASLGLYRGQGTVLNIGELSRVIRGLGLAAVLFLALLFLADLFVNGFAVPGGAILIGLLGGSLGVLVERRLLASFVKRLQLAGKLGRRVLIYGCGPTGERLMKKIVQAPDLGCTVVGFLDDFARLGATVGCRVTQTSEDRVEVHVLGRLEQLEEIVRDRKVDELLIAIPTLTSWKLSRILDAGRELRIRIGVVPRLGAIRADQLRADDVSGIPVLRASSLKQSAFYHLTKRVLDVGLVLALLVPMIPAWLLAAVLIRLDSPGPVILRQQRVGLHGRRFWMYKFRTMHAGVERYARSPTTDRDPRITRVGRWVRTAGFDETPQLLNVLKGEMSLVGPRPEMPFIVDGYGELERERLQALPGLTGLWQLSADRSLQIHENIEYDLYYIQNRSLLLDLAILLETVFFSLSVMAHRCLGMDAIWLMDGRQRASLPTRARPETRGFVLVALDQRMDGNLPDRWKRVLPALYELSREVRVRVLVAERNVGLLDNFVRKSLRTTRVGSGYRTEYLPYQGEEELYGLSREAEVLLTDMPQLAAWSRDGIDVVLLERSGGLRRCDPGSGESEVLQALFHGLGRPADERLERPRGAA